MLASRTLLAALVVTVAGDVRAAHHHHHAPTSYFLAANPHVPLAIVRGSSIASAVHPSARGHTCGSQSRWRVAGSRWRALDAWGQVVGTFAADAFDDYDVTGCAEVSFASAPKDDTVNVYVSVDSPWQPPSPAQFTPSPKERADFETLLADVTRGHAQRNATTECTEIAEERFFTMGCERFAVGGRVGGYVVASLSSGVWTRQLVHRERPQPGVTPGCFHPVAVFDMNGDGAPEIIMRDAWPGAWDDAVLEHTQSGWHTVAKSPGGSTA